MPGNLSRANARVHRYLVARGFEEIAVDHPTSVAYRGALEVGKARVPIRLDIRDWDFIRYPDITLLDAPPGFRPHLLRTGWLCYLAAGDVILNRHHADKAVAYCLEKAASVLADQAQTGYAERESREEFRVYWDQGKHTILHGTLGASEPLIARSLGNGMVLAGTRAEELDRCQPALQRDEATAIHPVCCSLITLRRTPWLEERGVPRTMAELLAWLKRIDSDAYSQLLQVMHRRLWKDWQGVYVLLQSSGGVFGFFMGLPHASRAALRQPRSDVRQHFTSGAGGRNPIEPFFAHDLSPKFIHERNLATAGSLAGLRLHLVGVGAIGGYLAQALVRLGAGTGGGALILCDPEPLWPENLGRHVLGFDGLFDYKVTALRQRLAQEFPYANIGAIINDARQWPNLFQADLVIDATGEQALSSVLSQAHQYQLTERSNCPPMAFTWVCGNGEAVQALWTDAGNRACYDCLWHFEPNGGMTERFRVSDAPVQSKLVGCRSITPYAVTAPLAAAGLCAQMIADWRNGNVSPRLRAIRLDGKPQRTSAKAGNPERLAKCPTCASLPLPR